MNDPRGIIFNFTSLEVSLLVVLAKLKIELNCVTVVSYVNVIKLVFMIDE